MTLRTLPLTLCALAAPLAAGCIPSDPGEDPVDPQPFDLAGIWTADVHYQALDGEPYERLGAGSFRFDPDGDGWICHRGGLESLECGILGEDPASFFLEDRYQRTYSYYTLTVHTRYEGEGLSAEGALKTSFRIDYTYDYIDGSQATLALTGEASLYQVEAFDDAPSSGLRLMGEFGGFSGDTASAKHAQHDDGLLGQEAAGLYNLTANVRVKDGYAYLARFSDGLYVLDVSDPAHVVEVAHAPAWEVGGSYYNDVKLFSTGGKDYAALSDDGLGLVIYDVTDPADPTFVSSFFDGLKRPDGTFVDTLNNHTAFIVGTTAYLGNYDGSTTLDPEGEGTSGGLLIVDLSDPAHPKELGRWLARDVGGHFVHDLMVRDGVAYLASWEAGMVALDVSQPDRLQVLGRFTYDRMTSHSVWAGEVAGRLVAAHGDEDFGSHLRIVDVDAASPTYMEEIGSLELRPQVSIHNVLISGDEVIAAHYQDGLRIYDLSDPTHPSLKAWYNSWLGYPDERYGLSFYEGAIGVDVADGRIYLADLQRGLLIFEEE